MDNSTEKLYEIDPNELQANPLQPRGVITHESLTDLVESIREQGILEPIVVANTPAGYQIIAGERRWRSAKILGLKSVPVRVINTTPQGMLELSIVENVQREDLNPIEKALAYKRLIDEFGLCTDDF
jgi:ParB family chromosome partitioning protein